MRPNDPAPYSGGCSIATPLPDPRTCRHKSFRKLAENGILNFAPGSRFCHSSQHFEVIFVKLNCNYYVVSGVFTTLASFNPFISITGDKKLDERKSGTDWSPVKPAGGQKRKFGRWMKKKPHRKATLPHHTEPSKVRMRT